MVALSLLVEGTEVIMVSWWILILCIVGAFTFGVLVMAILQLSRMRDRAVRSQVRISQDGLHPLDSPSQV